MNQPQQPAEHQALFTAFPIQPADPSGLGSKRVAITEFAADEVVLAGSPQVVDDKIRATLDGARNLNILAAYDWELYDNETACPIGPTLSGCGGHMLYQPNGTPSLGLQSLQRYAGWTQAAIATPTNLRTSPSVLVAGRALSLDGASAKRRRPLGDRERTRLLCRSMVRGAAATVTITVRNLGSTTWTAAGNIRLGAQNPQDNTSWGVGRVNLAAGDSIAPGATKAFTFVVHAPEAAGNDNFQWRLLQEGVAWFGDFTPNVVVRVH